MRPLNSKIRVAPLLDFAIFPLLMKAKTLLSFFDWQLKKKKLQQILKEEE